MLLNSVVGLDRLSSIGLLSLHWLGHQPSLACSHGLIEYFTAISKFNWRMGVSHLQSAGRYLTKYLVSHLKLSKLKTLLNF